MRGDNILEVYEIISTDRERCTVLSLLLEKTERQVK
jgi:hypothetical protein